MNYFVISNDGQKYGPADVATLNQWAQQGRVLPTSMLEDSATGQQIVANQLPGLMFPPPSGPAMGGPVGYPRGGAPYDDGSGDITKVWIFSALSLLCCPIVFGILAIVYASNAQKKGNPQGSTAMIVAIVALVLGIGVGAILRGAMSHSLR